MGAHVNAAMTGWKLLALLVLHLAALGLFVNGYLLTRIHLQEKSTQSTEAICSRPYKKLVWIIIDALRYDFVVPDGRYPCLSGDTCDHQHGMPKLSTLVKSNAESVRTFRYIADAPTTTTQRLKAMVSGGLPSFFDVSNAFSASAMSDDNIIEQFVTAGKRMVFMGDSTWSDLFPNQFNVSLPFPCYNVKDLDTVDDGVWRHLLPMLEKSHDWDVLIAHYLGVDHCGHTFGVESPQMTEKLQQMDKHITTALDFMLSSGDFDDALLLVAGDHGQTMGGDHGGGSPEEVDSVLVAVDIGGLRSSQSHSSGLRDWWNKFWSKPPRSETSSCKTNCTCGDDANQCVNDLFQIDLVPTLSILFGLPIPFGNLGTLSPELWSLGASRCGGAQNTSAYLAMATKATADQVYTYLETYAMHPASRFPRTAYQKLNALYANISDFDHLSGSTKFLNEANVIARQVWTQFNDLSMIGGLLIFFLALGWHGWLVWTGFKAVICAHKCHPTVGDSLFLIAILAGVAAQCVGIFSFFYLLSEGWMVTGIVSAMVGVLTLYVAAYVRRSSVKMLSWGAVTISCMIAAARLGMVSHSGYGFWQRLTVHEPILQDKNSVLETFSSGTIWWWKDGGPPMWQAICVHIITTTVPLLFIRHFAVSTLRIGFSMLRLLISMSYVLLATYFAIQTAIEKGAVAKSLSLLDVARRLQFGGRAMNEVVANFFSSVASVTPSLVSDTFALPLYLLIPRIVLLLGGITVVSAVLYWILIRNNEKGKLEEQHALLTAASAVASGVGTVMLQISSTFSPSMALLLIIGTMFIGRLSSQAKPPVGLWSLAGILSVMQTGAFYWTGHLCEFAGLQYTAGFVGFEEFNLVRSGLFVAIDTFGGMSIVILCVIGIVAMSFSSGKVDSKQPRSNVSNEDCTDIRDRKLSKSSGLLSHNLRFVVLYFGLSRALAAFCATLSSAVQRRHLYAWALFAPKFAFELYFLISTDVILLLLALLIRF